MMMMQQVQYQLQVLAIGAGVAGLQAIATAKRMGASFATDENGFKEQVESLGENF